jgi:hypothetical protein
VEGAHGHQGEEIQMANEEARCSEQVWLSAIEVSDSCEYTGGV